MLQEVCDDLTRHGVLKIPGEHSIVVQAVCPSFLKRKRRAADIPRHLLTAKDCRLVNFSPINDLVKGIPAPMFTPDDTHAMLGRWKEIIIFDLYSAFFQNHIAHKDQKWLGIMTPFSGLIVLAKSGQGLIGQSEELDQLLAKVFTQEMKKERWPGFRMTS